MLACINKEDNGIQWYGYEKRKRDQYIDLKNKIIINLKRKLPIIVKPKIIIEITILLL